MGFDCFVPPKIFFELARKQQSNVLGRGGLSDRCLSHCPIPREPWPCLLSRSVVAVDVGRAWYGDNCIEVPLLNKYWQFILCFM